MNYQYHIYIKDMEQQKPVIITDEHSCDEDAILHGSICTLKTYHLI
ncbi:hypothetical protein [Paenibacillus larvae]|nr:hypothetical protein [Paenibacillus larvae]